MIEYSEYKSELNETVKEITLSVMKVWIVIAVFCLLLSLYCVGIIIFVDTSAWKQAIEFFMPFLVILVICLSYYKTTKKEMETPMYITLCEEIRQTMGEQNNLYLGGKRSWLFVSQFFSG